MPGATVLPGQVDGRPNLTLIDGDRTFEATFIPGLGMIGCSLLHDGEQLLEMRDGPAAYEERQSTFGIPLLHPWANRLRAWSYEVGDVRVALDPQSPRIHRDGATGLPIHGLSAAVPYWDVLEARGDGDAARLRAQMQFGDHADLLDGFPFPHRLELAVTVTAGRLAVRVALTPTGDAAVPVSFGFHPYLRLPRSDRRSWEIELPVRRRLVLDDHGLPTGEAEAIDPSQISGPLGDRTFDDCFDLLERPADGGPAVFALADRRRRVTVEFGAAYDVAQIYSPPGAEFLCIEPMTAPVDALSSGAGLRMAEPGTTFTAEFAIAAQTLGS